jgi:hypothetical protein
VFVIRNKQLMLFREIINGFRAKHAEHINMFLRKMQNFVVKHDSVLPLIFKRLIAEMSKYDDYRTYPQDYSMQKNKE